MKCHEAFRSYGWTRSLFDFGRFFYDEVDRNRMRVYQLGEIRRLLRYRRSVWDFVNRRFQRRLPVSFCACWIGDMLSPTFKMGDIGSGREEY